MSDGRTALAPATAPPDVRRWIRRRRIAANGRVDPGTVYSVVLALAMAVALFGEPLLAVVWPARPATDVRDLIDVAAAAGLVLLALFSLLRQVGPLVVGRNDATWLLTAPVSREALLTPALLLMTVVALGVGGLTGWAVVGHLAPRPVPGAGLVTGIAAGAAAALAVSLAAVQSQRRPASARVVDLVAAAGIGALLLFAVGARTSAAASLPVAAPWPQWASAPASALVAAVLLTGALYAVVRVRRGLGRWPTHRIADASATTAAYADAVYAVEPSFLADLRERRFWQRHAGFRSSRLFRTDHIPPVVAHDLLTARRKASRIWWLAGTALVPALVADLASWLLVGVFLLGALGAAGLTANAVQSDARNPAMRRLLGLPAGQALRQRLVVPSLVAAGWCAVALPVLLTTGVAFGVWWYALGVAAGPAVAVAAVQRARTAASDLGSVLIDTPLGAFPAGLLLWLVNGLDVLALLTVPVSVSLIKAQSPQALGWLPVLVQAAASALGVVVLVRRADRATSAQH